MDESLQQLIDLINTDPAHIWMDVELHKQLLRVCTHSSLPPPHAYIVVFSAEYLDELFLVVDTLHD